MAITIKITIYSLYEYTNITNIHYILTILTYTNLGSQNAIDLLRAAFLLTLFHFYYPCHEVVLQFDSKYIQMLKVRYCK